MLANADIISELNRYEIPCFLEILFVSADGCKVQKSLAGDGESDRCRLGDGDSSRNLWLKIPYCERLSAGRTGHHPPAPHARRNPKATPTGTIGEFVAGHEGGCQRAGRPRGEEHPLSGEGRSPGRGGWAVNRVVHAGVSTGEAVDFLMKSRDVGLDTLTGSSSDEEAFDCERRQTPSLRNPGGRRRSINSSICGAIQEAMKHEAITAMYGSINGVLGS